MNPSFKVLSATLILCTGLMSGCATTTVVSGLQTGNLPPVGDFTADNGLQFNIQPLNLATLPPARVTAPNNDVYRLLQTSKRADYRITQGDVLSVILTAYPDISAASSALTVDQQGFVQLPLIGRIKASGLSVPQFTTNLRGQLQRYLKYSDPQVKITSYRGNKFYIDGEVGSPGEFAISDLPVSLYGAILLAGGVTPTGDANNMVLNRQGKNYSVGLKSLRQADASGNQIYLQNGDSIHINLKGLNKVYVLGEFGGAAPIAIPEQGLSLANVLGEARGLNSSTADAAKIYIVRDNPDYQRTNIYYVDMRTITSFALANRFEMQPNDILYVDPTGLTRWNRVLSAILPSNSLISGL